MGYNFNIGEARILRGEPDCPGMRILVDRVVLDEAPSFGADGGLPDLSSRSNERWPSYLGWKGFCAEVGLTEMFYGNAERWEGILHQHPGAASLFPVHLDQVRQAIARHLAKPWDAPERICAFEAPSEGRTWGDIDRAPDLRYDGTWARLAWLEWWIDWALRTCANPCFANG